MDPATIGRLLLAALALIALMLLPWLAIAPNRLLPGEALAAPAVLGAWVPLAAMLLVASIPRRMPALAAALCALGAALVMLAATGLAAAERLEGLGPAARASLGGGTWLALACAVALALARAASLRGLVRVGLAGLAGLALVLGWEAGLFERLSLVVEYRARAEALQHALLRHLALAGAALALALLVAAPLAWAGFRRPRLASAIAAVLAAVQVVPGLALFAILIPALAALLALVPALRSIGIGAIGPVPAVLATALYLALPLWRALLGGLVSADPAAVAAAEAMGMSEGRITREVRLPLALPVFAGGLRVALVQAIGLVTLGGLVGAGGLGALVFEGLAQFATDLMLLGALPIIALALLADTLARAAEHRFGAPV